MIADEGYRARVRNVLGFAVVASAAFYVLACLYSADLAMPHAVVLAGSMIALALVSRE